MTNGTLMQRKRRTFEIQMTLDENLLDTCITFRMTVMMINTFEERHENARSLFEIINHGCSTWTLFYLLSQHNYADGGKRSWECPLVSRTRTALFLSLIWNKHQKLSVKLFSVVTSIVSLINQWDGSIWLLSFSSSFQNKTNVSLDQPKSLPSHTHTRKPRSISVSIIVLPIVRSLLSRSPA